MKNTAHIEIDVDKCNQCPYFEWDPDNSCSNSDGSSVCTKARKVIERDYRNPDVPDWCPFLKK